MAFKTEAEKNAILKKYDHPDQNVLCPRCGGRLEYVEYPTAEKVECENRCISGVWRGL